MKVLIVNPDLRVLGGVSEYVRQLSGYLTVEKRHFAVGRRLEERGRWRMLFRSLLDAWRFVKVLRAFQPDLVYINPSLDWKGFLRDGLLCRLATRRGYPAVVFFHGWYWPVADAIERRFLWLFRLFFRRASGFIVLARDVEGALRLWGFEQPIQRELTLVDDTELAGFDAEEALTRRSSHQPWRVLFLGRVVRPKGIFELLETAALLPEMEFIVAGDGEDLEEAKAIAESQALGNVRFPGRVDTGTKRQLLMDCHVLLLPSYAEGFPGAVVEAMAFGLPVVTRPVGGIPDWLEDGVHALFVETLDPEDFAECLQRLKSSPVLYHSMARRSLAFFQQYCLASVAAKRLEDFFAHCLDHERNR